MMGEIDCNIIIAGDVNTLLSSMDKSSRQKISKESLTLNDTLHHMALIVIYKIFHSKTAEYTFFSSAHEKFSRINHILSHKTSLNKYKKNDSISSIFSNLRGMRLEINYKKKTGKSTSTWRLSFLQ